MWQAPSSNWATGRLNSCFPFNTLIRFGQQKFNWLHYRHFNISSLRPHIQTPRSGCVGTRVATKRLIRLLLGRQGQAVVSLVSTFATKPLRIKVKTLGNFEDYKCAASLTALQQVTENQFRYLKNSLPPHLEIIYSGREANRLGEGLAFVYDQRELAILQIGFQALGRVQGIPCFGARLPRMQGWAVFRDFFTGDNLVFVNVHLDHQSKQARLQGARQAKQKVLELANLYNSQKYFVLGDFNCGQAAHQIAVLHQKPLASMRLKSAHSDDSATFITMQVLRWQIDHIFGPDHLSPSEFEVDKTQLASDHRMISLKF